MAEEQDIAAVSDGGRTPSYERARDELAEVVRDLEKGGLTLEQSLTLWERGEELAKICEQWLEGARARMAAAQARDQDGDGTTGDGETPF